MEALDNWATAMLARYTGFRALRTGAGLNLVEFCGIGKNSENFSNVKALAGRERDQIMGLRDGSEVKIWSRAGL